MTNRRSKRKGAHSREAEGAIRILSILQKRLTRINLLIVVSVLGAASFAISFDVFFRSSVGLLEIRGRISTGSSTTARSEPGSPRTPPPNGAARPSGP
jgi:hypothetical protein